MVGPRVPLTDYLQVEGGRLREIDLILTRASGDLARQIRELKVVDEETAMTRIQLRAQQASIKAHLQQDWSDIATATDLGQRDAVAAASRTVSKYENEMWTLAGVPQADLKAMADMEAKRAARSVRTMMDREQRSLRPLAGSVYRARAVAGGMVDNAVNSALARGLSVEQFAQSIEQLVNPKVPGGVSYVARRLARTEINNAYHAGTKRRYEESGMVDACEWHKSKSHPEGDVCDDLEANSPYDAQNVPDKPHPQCLCYVTAVLPSVDDFIADVLGDKYGDQKKYIKEHAPAAIAVAGLRALGRELAPIAISYVQHQVAQEALRAGPRVELRALAAGATRAETVRAIERSSTAIRRIDAPPVARPAIPIEPIRRPPAIAPSVPTPVVPTLRAADDIDVGAGRFAVSTPDDVPRPNFPAVQPGSPDVTDGHLAIWQYTGNSKNINDKLRAIDLGEAKTGLNKKQRKLHDDLLKVVNSGQTDRDLQFVRGVYAPAVKDLLDQAGGDIEKTVGLTMRDGAFLSTSVGDEAIWGPYQLNILAPKGTRGVYVSDGHTLVGNQREFLMPPGSNFKVVKVRQGHIMKDGRKQKKTFIDVLLTQDIVSPADK